VDVVVVLSPGVTAYEALGAYGVFRRTSGATVRMVGERPGRVGAHGCKVALVAECSHRDVSRADVIVVPGGLGARRLVEDVEVTDWLRSRHETSQWTIGISTGSALLSAAGLLDGQDATTHWLATDLLEDRGAHPVPERMVRSGRIVTATGAVSGLQAALFVVGRMRGQDEADRIRGLLDEELTGPLRSNQPVGADTLAALSGVSGSDELTPYVTAVEGPGRRSRTARRRARSSPTGRSGRIDIVDTSPR
jgi:putative intracellular protease/amidase